MGGTAATVFNAANEAAVELFTEGKIGLSDIAELIEQCLDKHKVEASVSIEQLLEVDSWARAEVGRKVKVNKVKG